MKWKGHVAHMGEMPRGFNGETWEFETTWKT